MHVAASTGRMVAGRYLLQNTIGRGAMGTVWRARDTVLARDVAVKEVRLRGPVTAGSVMTEETRILYQRTLREARTAARLNHPAVVTVFDVVEADGSPWIVMELVQARSLDQVLTEDGPLHPQQAADIGRRVLGGLACAHAAGILHRDVKPSNVLLGRDGRVVLTDFGIATLEGDTGLTQAGMVMGTPGFTAPERIRGDAASPASDLWSLGATLFAAVEGRGPFDDRGNSIAILAAIANEEAPRPRSAGPLRHVIEALLHRNPQARPDTAAVSRLLTAAGSSMTRTGTAGTGAAGASAARTRAAGAGAAGAGAGAAGAGANGAVGAGGAAGIGTSRDAGRRAGQPPLTAPLGLAMPGPRAQPHASASGISQPGTPGPDGGPWEGPDDPWPEGPWPGSPPEPRDAPWASQIPPPTDPPTGGPQAAGAQSARALAALALAARVESARALVARILTASALAARELAARKPASRTPAAGPGADLSPGARSSASRTPAAGPGAAWTPAPGPEASRTPTAGPEAAWTPAAGPGAAWTPAPGPGASRTPIAGPRAARTLAAGPGATRTPAPGAGRHGAPAPGLRRGLAADLTAMVPRGRRGKLLVILGALAIVVAGILAGMALTQGGSGSGSAAPPARRAGSAAGFTMAVPAGWHTAQQGASTKFSGPAGDVSILVTPTSAGGAQDLGQTRLLLARALKRGNFPGYQPIGGRPFSFRGRAGVAWLFTWQPVSGGRREVRDIVFRAAAPGGGRAYLVQESAPVVVWAARQPEFRRALSTFRTGS